MWVKILSDKNDLNFKKYLDLQVKIKVIGIWIEEMFFIAKNISIYKENFN